MARVTISEKYCTVNPLKMSPSIGAALAFMGVDNSMPLLHGSQGCTSFGLVLFVRHFREAIPMQTTAMSEVATGSGRLRQCGTGISEYRCTHQAGVDRNLHDRNLGDQRAMI